MENATVQANANFVTGQVIVRTRKFGVTVNNIVTPFFKVTARYGQSEKAVRVRTEGTEYFRYVFVWLVVKFLVYF